MNSLTSKTLLDAGSLRADFISIKHNTAVTLSTQSESRAALASTQQRKKRKQSLSFNPSAFANLSAFDQALFQSFAQGPCVELPFTTLHSAFEHWATVQPHAIAATFNEQSISYAQLNNKANALAIKLQTQGVNAQCKVGLFVKRSIDMLVGMLAVLKTGAAYVPLDIGISPKQQIKTIVDIAQIKHILSLSEFQEKLPCDDCSIILLDQLASHQMSATTANLSVTPTPERLSIDATDYCAFVLFTSGTTGVPNGVQVSHKNVCNILLTAPGNLNIKPGLKVSQILNIAFDMSAWEIWGALCNGACLVIRGQCMTQAVAAADVVIATPSILGRIPLEQVRPIKAVAVAGEPCPRPLADEWSNACSFYNSCGPTETTIINTAQRHFAESRLLSIGSPTPNNTVYILDDNLTPCAIGETGEMWAGGDCVTLGYIANPLLTEQRYLPDPFMGGTSRMFRTRDLGRWTKNGQLEHLGRTDDQVKVRGFRVELDAVSNLLEQQSNIARAVTLKLNSRDLVAFAMPVNAGTPFDSDNALAQLRQALPYYSVPQHLIYLEKLPLTDRGKIDKNTLQEKYFASLNTQNNINPPLEAC